MPVALSYAALPRRATRQTISGVDSPRAPMLLVDPQLAAGVEAHGGAGRVLDQHGRRRLPILVGDEVHPVEAVRGRPDRSEIVGRVEVQVVLPIVPVYREGGSDEARRPEELLERPSPDRAR